MANIPKCSSKSLETFTNDTQSTVLAIGYWQLEQRHNGCPLHIDSGQVLLQRTLLLHYQHRGPRIPVCSPSPLLKASNIV
jgi:hypothetical protein